MKHADGALLTIYYFILCHIILCILVSHMSEPSPVIFVTKSLLSPDYVAPIKQGFVTAHRIVNG